MRGRDVSTINRLALAVPSQTERKVCRYTQIAKMNRLTVSSERQGVVLLPGRVLRSMVVSVSLSDSSRLLSSRSEASGLPALVDGVANPVDAGITADGLVCRVDENDFVVLVYTVLVDPVGLVVGEPSQHSRRPQYAVSRPLLPTHVQNTKTTASPCNSLFGNAPQASLELELVYTLVGGFTKGSTLGSLLFPSTSANSDSVDDVSLLGLVTQSASLVGSRRSGCSVDDIELTVLPASDLLVTVL